MQVINKISGSSAIRREDFQEKDMLFIELITNPTDSGFKYQRGVTKLLMRKPYDRLVTGLRLKIRIIP